MPKNPLAQLALRMRYWSTTAGKGKDSKHRDDCFLFCGEVDCQMLCKETEKESAHSFNCKDEYLDPFRLRL